MKRFILFLNLFLVFAGTLTAQTVTTIDALKTALVSGTEPTITLGADGLVLNSVITTSRTVTLDLNNHTLSTDCQEGALTVTGGGNLTIKNGTLAGERGDFLTAKGGTINLESTLESPLIVTGYSSIVWAYDGGVVNINGAKLRTTNTPVAGCTSGEYAAVSATNNGTIVVNEGSEVKADRKSALRCLTGGTITVNGGNIISEANGDSGDGAVLCSGGTYVINNGTFTTPNTETVKINSGSITVNGGTFTTCESCNVVFMKTNGTVTLKGGTYNRNVTPYVAQGYTCIQTGDVKWTVTQGLVQRTSGTTVTYYPTLKLAADASIAGDEIKLLADFTSTEVATFAFPVTLDLNGKTLTVNVSKGLTVNSSEVVKMTNGTITSTENPVYNIGGLTIENVSITTTNAGDVHAILTEGNNAVLNVEGANTSIKAVEGGAIVAKDGATLNINNGAMENVHSVTNNTPTVWISNATANVNGETTSILSTQGNALGATAGATVTINNGTLNSQGTNGSPTAYSEGGNSKIIVNGGIIKSKTISALTASAGKVEINGGNILTEEQSNYPVVWAYYGGSIDINGGEINGKGRAVMSGSGSNNGTVTIKGGTMISENSQGVYAWGGKVTITNDSTDNTVKRPRINGTQAVINNGGTVTITGGIFSDDVKNDADKYPTSFVADGLGTKVIIDNDHSRLENGYMWQVEALDTVLISGKTYNYFYIADTIRKPSTADDRGFTATLQSDGSDVLANVQLKEGHQVLAKGFDKGEYPMNLTADMFMAAEPTPNQNVGAGPYAFKVVQDGKLIIKPRMLDYKFKENKGSKNYDGTVLVATYDDIEAVAHTEVGYGLVGNDHFTAGTLTTSDYIAGTYPCTIGQFQADGDLETIVEGFAIMNGDENKTGNYTPVFGKLALTINKLPITVTATDQKEYDELPFGPETEDGYTLTGSLADGDEITVEISEDDEVCPGTYANAITNVTVNKTDDNNRDVTSSYAITKVNGNLTIDPLACTGTFTYEGYDYPLVLINGQCWFAENLRVAKEGATAYKEDDANLEKFGYLYDWATALGDNGTKETDVCNGDFVQGICPQGWALPSNADFQALENYAHGVEAIKSDNANYWQLQYVGTDEYGFDERAGGFFKSALNRYEDLLTGAHFWTSESVLNPSIVTEGEAYSYCTAYYCTEFLPQIKSVNDKLSVRCIRKTPYENGEGGSTEPEPFTCGTSKMKDADNNEYETVLIGNQCWTKTNLRTAKDKDGNDLVNGGSNTSITDPYYYVNPDVDAATYGYYYNWAAAKLACPSGWHLPSDAEWTQLTDYVSNQSAYTCGDNNANIAKALASNITAWTSYEDNSCAPGNAPSGNNATGFAAVPAGFFYSSFGSAGNGADFWSSSQYSSNNAWSRFLIYTNAGVNRYSGSKFHGRSVRCLRD
ncbi:MAG: hypothetical protein IKN78_09170 [Bacteroidales bacterium]|nr:hypothetical protein [Bacteroidales bacterium]